MRDHPENPARPLASYDPDEPLIVRYADVIAARNAVAALHNMVADRTLVEGQDEAVDYHLLAIAHLLKASVEVDTNGRDHYLTRQEAVEFTRGLRDRLAGCLPTLRPTAG